MEDLSIITTQVREVLIETEDTISKHDLYTRFVNECKTLSLSEDDFYKKVLKPAHKSIDWDYIESEKKRKEETQKKFETELAEVETLIQSAPIYIDRLVKTAFEDGVVESMELRKIFEKAKTLKQDTNALAEKLNALLDEKNYKSYPTANFDAPNLKETLLSTNWYNEQNYTKITTPPPPPPVAPPWKMIVTGALLLALVAGTFFYFSWYKPYLKDKNAQRMYSMANDVSLRSSPQAGVNYNFIQKIDYGSEILVYQNSGEWATVKVNGKEGYVTSRYLLNKKDFTELNGIFGDMESKETVATSKCRKALLDYFQKKDLIGKIDLVLQKEIYNGVVQNREVWQIFAKGKAITPNTVIFPRITRQGSKFTDFGFIIKNITTGKRKFVLYSFADDETPTFVADADAPDQGDIKSIKRNYAGAFEPVYSY